MNYVKCKYIVGIDEVGRGPLAGPVTLGFVMVQLKDQKRFNRLCKKVGVTDSKKLSQKKREEIEEIAKQWKKEGFITYCTVSSSSTHIDTYGIVPSIKKSIASGLRRLRSGLNEKDKPSYYKILLDGSLKAPDQYDNQQTIIKGDLKEPLIALASIIAKVHRDKLMDQYAKKYPKYGFEKHKGYGTLEHRKRIKVQGFSKIHRKTFCSNIINNL